MHVATIPAMGISILGIWVDGEPRRTEGDERLLLALVPAVRPVCVVVLLCWVGTCVGHVACGLPTWMNVRRAIPHRHNS